MLVKHPLYYLYGVAMGHHAFTVFPSSSYCEYESCMIPWIYDWRLVPYIILTWCYSVHSNETINISKLNMCSRSHTMSLQNLQHWHWKEEEDEICPGNEEGNWVVNNKIYVAHNCIIYIFNKSLKYEYLNLAPYSPNIMWYIEFFVIYV